LTDPVALFDLHDVSARYNGRVVLDNISLRIAEGERVALVGRSGAGKSTLLRLLYEHCTATVSLLPQELGLVRNLSVFHNIYIGRLNHHSLWYNLVNLIRPLKPEVEAVRAIARRMDIEEKLFEPVGELSGGQQQRTAVARALYQASPILIGDEPVSAVDEHQARLVLENINKNHRTVLIAMHDTTLAIAYSDRIIGLRDAKIVLDRPTAGMIPSDLDDLYRN
jgi:phosphonate transport system ATP-binding protein